MKLCLFSFLLHVRGQWRVVVGYVGNQDVYMRPELVPGGSEEY